MFARNRSFLPAVTIALLSIPPAFADTWTSTTSYVAPAFGFEIETPAGWTYDRSTFREFKDTTGLLRGRSPDGREAIQVQVFRIQPTLVETADHKRELNLPTFEDWMVNFGKTIEGVATERGLDWEPWKLPPRAGAVLQYEVNLKKGAVRTCALCLPLDPGNVLVFAYSSTQPDAPGRMLRERFDRLIAALKVHFDPPLADDLAEALRKGRGVVRRIKRHAKDVALDNQTYYYDIFVGGRPVGYMTRQVSREEHNFTGSAHRKDIRAGLRVRERSWRFNDDGTVQYERLDLFSSFDLENELIERQWTLTPGPTDEVQVPLVKTDRVMRRAENLYASFTTNRDTTLPPPGTPVAVGPVYLDLAWQRLSPGLLLNAPQKPHAFAAYDTATRAVRTQMLSPLGRQPAQGYSGTAFAYELREGLTNRPMKLLVDNRGNLIRGEAGDLVILRTSREVVDRRWGAKRHEVRDRYALPRDD